MLVKKKNTLHNYTDNRTMTRRKRVMIVDSSDIFRIGLKAILHADDSDTEIYEATTYKEFEDNSFHNNIDVLVINQTLIQDFERLPGAEIVVVAENPDLFILTSSFLHGAKCYLLKSSTSTLFKAAVKLSEPDFFIDPSLQAWAARNLRCSCL